MANIKRAASFQGGVTIPGKKSLSGDSPIETLPLPKRVVIPLLQHTGAPAKPSVTVGQHVMAGECIGAPGGVVSAPVHASISGTVVEIVEKALIGDVRSLTITIEGDGSDGCVLLPVFDPWETADPALLLARIDEAGVVGLGGAAFPSKVKLSPPPGKIIDTLIINGAECEPYLTADYRLMVERAPNVVSGIRILMRVLGVSKAMVGIEKHSKSAVESMEAATGRDQAISLHTLKVKYPQGAEKMLVKALLNREIPSGGLPADAGVVVHNIGTAEAVYGAVCVGRPLIERVVTVSGEEIVHPKNLLVRIGTPVSALIDACGGVKGGNVTVVAGGPMMGTALTRLDVPVIKGMSGIIVLPAQGDRAAVDPVCINCGRCFAACPLGLEPSELADLDTANTDDARKLGALDCCQCGACSAVCPARRKNSEIIKQLKSAIIKEPRT